MKNYLIGFSTIFIGLTLTSCGTNSADTSDLNYITWSQSSVNRSTMADATKETLTICLKGNVSSANLERSQAWSTRAVLT